MAKTLFVAGPDPLGLAMLVLFRPDSALTTIGFWMR
jgi:hypothetical protein